MLTTVLVYLLQMAALYTLANRVADLAKDYKLPVGLTCFSVVFLLLYLSCLLPGALGILYPSTMEIAYFILFAMLLFIMARFRSSRFGRIEGRPAADGQANSIEWTPVDLTTVTIGICSCVPLLDYLRFFPRYVWDQQMPLSGDVVAYHLPDFIEFLQNHTLWTMRNSFQSYSFGFEFIGNIFSAPFHSQFGIVIAHLGAILYLVFAVCHLTRHCLETLEEGAPINWVPPAVLGIGTWAYVFRYDLASPGLNDIFLAACLLSALAFLLEAIQCSDTVELSKQGLCLWLSATNVGLALATKPTALAYVPFFFAFMLYSAFVGRGISDVKSHAGKVFVLFLYTTWIFVVGGFFLVRNLIRLGHLSAPTDGWHWSVLAYLGNRTLYASNTRSELLLPVFVSLIAHAVFVASRWSRLSIRSFAATMFAFHLAACAIFLITPFGILNDPSVTLMQPRLGMTLFVFSGIILFILLQVFLRSFRLAIARGGKLAGVALFLAFNCLVAVHCYKSPLVGLPGYEATKGLPPTKVYQWVQAQQQPLRIYSAGLRPYGLFGDRWQNTLFYDLHSLPLLDRPEAPTHIARVALQFQPNLILISVDPHSYSGDPKKPSVVGWLKEHPDCFQEVYTDETVSGFRVIDVNPLRGMVTDHLPIQMGS